MNLFGLRQSWEPLLIVATVVDTILSRQVGMKLAYKALGGLLVYVATNSPVESKCTSLEGLAAPSETQGLQKSKTRHECVKWRRASRRHVNADDLLVSWC